jgi:hypothetical protein
MPTAQLNIRVPFEHHDLVRTVAARLREDKEFAESLAAFVADHSSTVSPASMPATILDELAAIKARLDALEAIPFQKPVGASLDAVKREESGVVALEPEAPVARSNEPQRRRPWTEADDAVLRRIAGSGGTQADACYELGRPESVISLKWRKLGLPIEPRKGRKLKSRA